MARKKKVITDEEGVARLNEAARLEAEEKEIVDYVVGLALEGLDYMNQFKPGWDDVISKIRCEHPAEWKLKEDWQTKFFVPMFSKGSEVVMAYLNKMLFNAKRFYSLYATKTELNKYLESLMELIDAILDRGRFTFAKNFALQEGIDIGTSFIKPLVRPDKRGIDFTWRTPYAAICDVGARNDFYKSRFWADNYKYDLHQMINDVRMGGNALWTKDGVDKLIFDGVADAEEYKAKCSANETEYENNIAVVQNIDGTNQMTVTTAFADVEVWEFWGAVPIRKTKWDTNQNRNVVYYEYENRQITIGNRKRVLKNVPMSYKKIPAFPIRTKKRPYDLYGQGFFLNCTGLQELVNSMMCLGFDSAKLDSLDMIVMDKSKANDTESIVYKPGQIWDVKNPADVKMTRPNNGMSAINDALKGSAYIDGVFQDTTGATRQSSGSTALPGTSGGDQDTLGIYQYQLQMVDQRFLDQAKFIEDDFEYQILHFVLDCILDPALISQEFIDEILGFEAIPEMDANGQPTGITKNVSRLNQEELIAKLNEFGSKDKSSDLDFTTIGLNQFIEKISLLKKLDGLIERATTNQAFAPYTKVNQVVKRWFELSEIPDWEEFYNKEAPETPPFPPSVQPNGVIQGNPINPQIPAKSQVTPPVSMGG